MDDGTEYFSPEAEAGVAKAKVGVAEAKWDRATEEQKALQAADGPSSPKGSWTPTWGG